MNSMTCQQVHDQLDLLAADACDASTRKTVEAHLRSCRACSAGYAESQQLIGLLDLHWSENGIQRLQERIAKEARQKPRRLLAPFVRRAALAAALFLITVGLLWWLPGTEERSARPEPQLALLVRSGPSKLLSDQPPPNEKAFALMNLPEPNEHRGDAFRKKLLKAKVDGKLLPPTEVHLTLTLVNTGKTTVELRLGEQATELSLEIQGKGVVRIPVGEVAKPAFLRRHTLQLPPGKQYVLRIDRLITGSRGRLEYVYLTENGEYTVTAKLRLMVDARIVTVTGEAVRVTIGK